MYISFLWQSVFDSGSLNHFSVDVNLVVVSRVFGSGVKFLQSTLYVILILIFAQQLILNLSCFCILKINSKLMLHIDRNVVGLYYCQRSLIRGTKILLLMIFVAIINFNQFQQPSSHQTARMCGVRFLLQYWNNFLIFNIWYKNILLKSRFNFVQKFLPQKSLFQLHLYSCAKIQFKCHISGYNNFFIFFYQIIDLEFIRYIDVI
eukprot:TRINITY_DN2653_c0_g1_i5.p2 TRINITY_DN2653_c0_g1~~TRINITY_DN2653_c0_g1_i5.p2  ORF type:complete len:205 (-),score=-13.11 TRINITY_DN2653_c0_g1_i5:697-1311(-)